MSGNRKLSRKFKKAQGDKDLELLLSSSSSYKVCGIVEYDGFIKKSVDPEGMSLIRELPIEDDEKNMLLKSIKELPFLDHGLANQEVESSTEIGIETDIPNLNSEIIGNFKSHKVSKYIYEGVRAKEITGEIKKKIKDIVLRVKEEDGKSYRKKFKGLFYFEHLYYAEKVSIVFENATDVDVKATVKKMSFSPKVSLSSDKKTLLSFPSSDSCPFAAKVSSIKDLID